MPMLTRDWSEVKKVAPELFGIVGVIERFLESNKFMNHVEPGRIARQFKCDLGQVFLACEIARDRKLVKRSWGVLEPRMKCHAIGYWDRLSRIPRKLYDTADEPFKRDDGEYIIIYRHPEETDHV